MYVLFIDDLRNPSNSNVPARYAKHEIVIARSSFEAITILNTRGRPVHVCLDHDLGGDDTSMVVLKYMQENNLLPDTHSVHSANPVGAANMNAFLYWAYKN